MKRAILVLVIVVVFWPVSVIWADDSSQSGILGTNQSSPSGSILEKLNILKTEIASKAAEIKAQVGRAIENKAWNGVIKTKSDSLMVVTTTGGDRNININEYTLYTTGKIKDKGTLKELAVGDFIVAIGDVDDKSFLQAKKIIRTKRVMLIKQLIWGQINDVKNSLINLKTTSSNQEVKVDDATAFWLGGKEASLQDAKKGKFLLAVLEGSSSASLATTVYFIPTTGYFKPEKKASPSAKLNSPNPTVLKSATKK